MDDEMMEFGGFSLAKIVLSNALPSSLYYPDPPDYLRGKQDAPVEKKDEKKDEEKDEEEKTPE